MAKVESSPSRVDHWNTLRGNSRTRCWFDTAHAVWEALKNAYAQDSQEHEFTL
jgi:hypothetical protein